jgi:protein-tyrosine phosphatase
MSPNPDPSPAAPDRPRVLFLCTGNFYRSRFAEAVFNHHARERSSNWEAFSRGLAIHLAQGALARETIEGLRERGIEVTHTAAEPCKLCVDDLTGAAVVVALHEPEHRPMMLRHFPDWVERTVFWTVPDVNEVHHHTALPEIERRVLALLDQLQADH